MRSLGKKSAARWWVLAGLTGLASLAGLAGLTSPLVACNYNWPEALPAADASPPNDGEIDGEIDADSDARPDEDSSPGTCGDGVIEGDEPCDDGNTASGDGCGPGCEIEPGWYCAQEPSVCTTQCGDGTAVAGHEECDDGNTVAGDGCDASCRIDCANLSRTDCNAAGSTKIPSSAFVDPEPPAGFVQCAGFINTADDDVDRHWETPCLGVDHTLRIRYWDVTTDPWTLLADATLGPPCTASYDAQTFDATNHGGSEGVLEAAGVELLKDAPGAGLGGQTSTVECVFTGGTNDYGANDLYLANRVNDKTLWVCSGDRALHTQPCAPANELALVNASLGACVDQSIDATRLAVALYFQVP
jgi:cysteine-rich repeat protein